ncbi:MAG TPA: hypothetical protein VFF15_01580 [Flavobacteriaceae bacterium]|nr:hypothetical protein [Flavobacteriaceae bacterium]
MKLYTFAALFCYAVLFNFTFAQEEPLEKTNGIFYKFSIAGTLTTNEDYTLGNEEGEPFITLNAIFVNTVVGYQFDKRSTLGVALEYDRHFRDGLNFLPVFFEFKYNLFHFDDNFFIRGGYGKLVNVNSAFETGTLYRLGLGVQLFDNNYKNSYLLGLDFTRKRFGYRQSDKLSSVSVFFEFMLF